VMSTAHRIRPGSLWRPRHGDRLIGAPRALRLAVLPAAPPRTAFGLPGPLGLPHLSGHT